MDDIKPQKTNVTLGMISRWLVGSIFLLLGFLFIVADNILPGVFLIIGSFVLLPPIAEYIEDKMNITMSGSARAIVVIILFLACAVTLPHNTATNANINIASGNNANTNTADAIAAKADTANTNSANTNSANTDSANTDSANTNSANDNKPEATPTPITTSTMVKTLADKDPEFQGTKPSESTQSGASSTPTSSSSTSSSSTSLSSTSSSSTSSTPNIFNYCTCQAQFTTQIGKYNTAPAGKNYVVITLNIDNKGEQTYSTNGNYWHLKIGDMYHEYDTATYDTSMNHLTTDIGPGGKITTKIVYLVDGNPSISDMGMYYDGPGSDRTISSSSYGKIDPSEEPINNVGNSGNIQSGASSSSTSSTPTSSSSTSLSSTSSTPNIFNYCTCQAQFTTQIGKYNTASAGKNYVVITLNIDNKGEQTYSTNGNYWHLKIGDMYHEYDTATYDTSMNHLTTDIGPGGKITTKIVYLVDGNPSISDMGMYYDGPGSDGIISS